MHRHFKQYIMKKVIVGRRQQCKRRLSQIFVIQLFLYQMAGDDSALSRLGDWDGYQVSSHLTTEIQETTHRKGQGVCWIQRICFFSISSQAFFLKIGLHGHTSVRMWQKQQNINTPHFCQETACEVLAPERKQNNSRDKKSGICCCGTGGESVNIIQKNLRLKAVVFKVPSHVWNEEKLIYNCQQQQNKIKSRCPSSLQKMTLKLRRNMRF